MSSLIQGETTVEARMINTLWVGTLISYGALCLAAVIFAPWHQAVSVAVGGLIAIANFKLLQRTILGVLKPDHAGSPMASILIKYYLRFIATCVVLFLLVKFEVVKPLGLLVGLSVIILSVIAAGVVQACKINKEAV